MLGAAVWLIDLEDREREAATVGYANARLAALIDRFKEATGGIFECERITGRRFGNVAEHADFLGAGGCSQLIDVLANLQDR